MNEIIQLRHPDYINNYTNYPLWRSILTSGVDFIEQYLRRFPNRETYEEFTIRKSLTYVPAFAKSNLEEIKNAIFQRALGISRTSKSMTYMEGVTGQNGGVDNKHSSMTGFLGENVLMEMMGMSKVCVYVDAPADIGNTRADDQKMKPFLYTYNAEDILSWNVNTQGKLTAILLRQKIENVDAESGLIKDCRIGYRHLIMTDAGVKVTDYNSEGEIKVSKILKLKSLPCVIVNIKSSLLTDIARHQIALLQLASSDVAYGLTSNFPFYVEQFNAQRSPQYIRNPSDADADGDYTDDTPKVENPDKKVNAGVGRGRRYPKGLEQPAFIHPSSEPLKISMEKQREIRNEIRQLIQLAVSNLGENPASADSREFENRGLESGLCYIGQQLERSEKAICEIWQDYESIYSPYDIVYPRTYSLQDHSSMREEVKDLMQVLKTSTSIKHRKILLKRIAVLSVEYNLTDAELKEINVEIEESDFTITDPDVITEDVAAGVLSAEDAARIRGYPEDTVEKAQKEHADRLKRIQDAQAPVDGNPAARGVKDLGGDASHEKDDSQDVTEDGDIKSKTRGAE